MNSQTKKRYRSIHQIATSLADEDPLFAEELSAPEADLNKIAWKIWERAKELGISEVARITPGMIAGVIRNFRTGWGVCTWGKWMEG
jgi:hypothetical protein